MPTGRENQSGETRTAWGGGQPAAIDACRLWHTLPVSESDPDHVRFWGHIVRADSGSWTGDDPFSPSVIGCLLLGIRAVIDVLISCRIAAEHSTGPATFRDI